MKLSSKEKSIIEYLQELKVSTKDNIYQAIDVSSRTIDRALSKYGYYSSYNYNASYYTLKDIPSFDSNGLWSYGDVRFSRYKTLVKTIISIVAKSECGYTNVELSQLLGTETKIILSRLSKQNKILKFNSGRQAVYISNNPLQSNAQRESRDNQRRQQLEQTQKPHWDSGILPEGIDVMTIIPVLTGMIQNPHVNIASLTAHLQAQDVKVTAEEIGYIISFYGLEKKTVR